MTDERPIHIDLFSGIAGFAIAADWAGFRTVAFCEIEAYCQTLIKERFGAVMAHTERDGCRKGRTPNAEHQSWTALSCNASPTLWPDIRRMDGRLYRGAALLTGGFPCQPFSVAGKRAGTSDDRFLWPEMLRVIDEARPAWVLGENVAGLVQMELDRVLSDLEGISYACWPLVIPACAVDAKHRRDRVWIVGYANNTRWATQPERCERNKRGRVSNSGEAMAHANGCNGHRGGSALQVGRIWGAGEAPHDDDSRGVEWLPEPAVGRVVDELPVGVDGHCVFQPEPEGVPRVAKGVKNRVERLKGLGNAILPSLAYEILREIRKLI